MVAKFLADNKPETSLEWIRTLSNFIELIQFHLICKIWRKLLKLPPVPVGGGGVTLETEKKKK